MTSTLNTFKGFSGVLLNNWYCYVMEIILLVLLKEFPKQYYTNALKIQGLQFYRKSLLVEMVILKIFHLLIRSYSFLMPPVSETYKRKYPPIENVLKVAVCFKTDTM